MLSGNEFSSSENIQLMDEKPSFRTKYSSQIKLFAFLSMLLFGFLSISVVSYNKSDIEKSTISISDLFGLFRQDPEILARQATTQNWLGLFGAFLSDILINRTFGYSVLILLFLGIYLSISLFPKQINTRKIATNTLFWILITIFLSGFFGSLSQFDWLGDIPFEWSGLVGYFLAFFISSIVGEFGAFLLFLLAIFVTIFYKLEFKITDIFKYIYYNIKTFLDNRKQNDVDDFDTNKPENTMESNNIAEATQQKESSNPINQNSVGLSKKITIPPNPLEINNEFSSTNKSNLEETKRFVPKIQFIDPSKIAISNKDIEEEFKKEIIPNWESDIIEQKEEISTNNQLILEYKQGKSEQSKDDKEKIENQESNSNEYLNQHFTHLELNVASENENRENQSINIENQSDETILEIDKMINELVKIDNKKEAPETLHKNIKINIKETPTETQPDVLLPKSEQNELKAMFYTEHSEYKIKYKFPSINNLIKTEVDTGFDYKEFETNAKILQEKLETFKIFIENIEITPGPVVTLYEFVPAPGIKISRIESLADDIEMALKAKGVRIIAPMPGKGTVGVEIPNSKPKIVRFGDIVASEKFQRTEARLPLAFGKTINGEIFIEDLTKMPHLLIAGATGTGKSVGINTIINSLLFSIHPQHLKFVIIDPKKVEMPQYAALSQHYLATSPDVDSLIITNPKDAVLILKSCVIEMENRYEVLADAGQRNIVDYNKKIAEGKLRHSEKIKHAPMPYLVIIIDELADLMLTASKEIEEPITRLAQMARAVGIHLVVATQRPSVDVITGLIKANFPARLAYMTTSKIDSRTILDQQGAEQLLGAGDMLILPPGRPKPIRVQNAFITTEEVERVCEEIAKQEGYPEPYLLPSVVAEENEEKYIDPNDRDPLFEEAARLVVSSQQASVSMLQRRLKIGFARAGRIMDELEAAGIVGSSRGSKTREVLLESESQLEAYL